MKRKSLTAIVAVILTVALAACGANTNSHNKDTNSKQAEQTQSVDLKSCVTGIRDLTVEVNSKPDYMDGIKWDKDYVKDVTYDDKEVKLDKAGSYKLVYSINPVADLKTATVTVDVTVKVKMTEEEKKAEEQKAEQAKQETPQPADTNGKTVAKSDNGSNNGTSKPSNSGSKPSGGNNGGNSASKPNPPANNGNSGSNNGGGSNSGNSGSNSGNSGNNKPSEPAQPEKPAHQHSFAFSSYASNGDCMHEKVAIYACSCGATERRNAGFGNHNPVYHEAVTKEEPIYGPVTICNGCGAKFYGPNQAMDAADHTSAVFGDACSNYRTATVILDYKTVTVSEAYTECDICHQRL